MRAADRRRRLFLVAAVFNFAVAFGLGLMPRVLFPLLDMPAPQERLTFDLFVGCVAIFGLQYLLVAGSPETRQSLIVLGAIGKSAVFLTLLWHWLGVGDASAKIVVLGVVDLAFAALFVWVLIELRSADG